VHGLVLILSGLARVMAGDDPEEARRLADDAVAMSDARNRCMASCAAGWIAFICFHDVTSARRHAAVAEAAAAQTRDRAGLAEAFELSAVCDREVAIRRLDDAIAIWKAIESPIGEARARVARAQLQGGPEGASEAAAAGAELRQRGVRLEPAAAGLLAAVAPRSQGLRINTLGGFRLFRDGQAFPLSDWRSRKALTLLKLLAVRQGHPMRRDAIAEVLWSDEDSSRAAGRTSELINSVRNLLDPNQRYPKHHYIAGDRHTVALDVDHVDLDVLRLLRASREGLRHAAKEEWEKAQPLLQSAEDAYAGDLLEEDAYEEWTADCREQARLAACEASRALARIAARNSDEESACRHLRRVLERDPHDEEAWVGLISSLVRMRRHGESRRAYATYTRRMVELGVTPAPFDDRVAGMRQESSTERLLATVLFTDIVGSTAHVSTLGDRGWRSVLDVHDTLVRHELERHNGREIKAMGDGILATFDSPARAVACADRIREGVRSLGLQVRCGLHTGEVELRGDDIGGMAVHIAARISRAAAPGEVLVSRTVKDLLTGSDVVTADRGLHALTGIPEKWQLYAVECL
jgi:class 3 adenylate cyclase